MSKENEYMLIVDDDAQFVEDTVNILKLAGYDHVLSETNPIRALELVKKHNIVFIISDFRMPSINGIAFFKNIKNLNFNRKIHKVIYTGYSEMENEMDAIKREGIIDDFIFKSSNAFMFLLVVKQCWERITSTSTA